MKDKTAAIHSRLVELARRHRLCLAETLEKLSELNRRKGFVELGHESLLKYCVKELGLSESAAYRRIKALKIVERSESVKANLVEGNLNLSQISRAEELFESFKHETGGSLNPSQKESLLETVKGKDSHASECEIRERLSLPQKPRKITIEVSDETYNEWKNLKSSFAHKDMSDEMLLRFAISQAARVDEPSRKVTPKNHDRSSRYIPAHIRREVFKKAAYKCSWKGCDSVYALEVDHIKPFSQGGKTEIGNLRLLCRNHNQARNYD